MADIVKEILTRPIQLADQVTKACDEVRSFRQECQELKSKTERLAGILRQVARARNDLYERPTRHIIDDTEQVLEKSLSLVLKCRINSFVKRAFTIIQVSSFRKISQQLENSIGDVSWLLRVSSSSEDNEGYLGLPPIAANQPILCLIWEQIAILYAGSLEARSDAAASLVSLARDNDRYCKLIIEEGGVAPLLKLAKEGKLEGQENAARAIGLLGKDPESVEQIVNAGACSVFAKILKEGHMKVQAVVAWAISELATHHPKCQDPFAQNNVVRLLVSHLAFETVQEHSKYAIASKQKISIHSALMTLSNSSQGSNPNQAGVGHSDLHSNSTQHKQVNNSCIALSGTSVKGREFEDPATKNSMKAMAARALSLLCKGNLSISRTITESRALLCLAILVDKATDDVQYYSIMALLELSAVAEQNSELRRSAFKPNSPAATAVVDQLLRIIAHQPDSEFLIPCVQALGNLARTFRATETRIIPTLVKLLDDSDPEVAAQAVLALTKFTCTHNFLHLNHSKSIIEADGLKHLVQLAYFGEYAVQLPALILLSYIALHVPDSQELAQEQVLIVLDWALKQGSFNQEELVYSLVPEAKSRLELYQSRNAR